MSSSRKVLLVTMQDYNNMGNRLQNWALQYVLEQHHLEVTNLDSGYVEERVLSSKDKLKKIIKKVLAILGVKKYYQKVQIENNQQTRYRVNKEFSDQQIHNLKKVTYDDVYQRDWNNYDLAIVGSDQVWHKWREVDSELPYYYLEFLPHQKRNSYAASFGFDEFPEEDRQQHIKGIKGMNNISCRESTGCKLVEDIIGKQVPHVLDPTLLLSANDWRKMTQDSNRFSQSQQGYAFMYFLGEKTPEYEAEIDRIIEAKHLKKIDFLDFTNAEVANCGPKEFVKLIENADYVLTDSFHCCVFSILFGKDFEVFRRKEAGMEKMFSRIEELLLNTGNGDKAYGGLNPELKGTDFDKLRQTSLYYLDKVLS